MGGQTSTFLGKTKLVHGFGTTSVAGQEATRLGVNKALLVTDKGVRSSGLLTGVDASLAASGVAFEVFDEVEQDATVATMQRGAQQVKDRNCNGVIVVGGGSPICAGKGIALEATNGQGIGRYEGRNMYSRPPLPVICLPTTAAVASPDKIRGEIVKAFVILAPGYPPSDSLASELQEHVKKVTAPYKYPRAVEFVNDLPKTISGKIIRKELRERERAKSPGEDSAR